MFWFPLVGGRREVRGNWVPITPGNDGTPLRVREPAGNRYPCKAPTRLDLPDLNAPHERHRANTDDKPARGYAGEGHPGKLPPGDRVLSTRSMWIIIATLLFLPGTVQVHHLRHDRHLGEHREGAAYVICGCGYLGCNGRTVILDNTMFKYLRHQEVYVGGLAQWRGR